jgi:dipeptidase D
MKESIRLLQPQNVWEFFDDICQIPRPSKKEEKIKAYLLEFGNKYNLETLEDEIGNILIRKNATKGYENYPWVVMQSHMDMVCEKNSDVEHDFEKDPIQTRIENGWVKAIGTTLGADDGIGVATQLAILSSDNIEHGSIECLFTVDEESGLSAGGMDTVVSFNLELEDAPIDNKWYKIEVNGLRGGHSGDDIQKGYGNANKVLNRILYKGARDFS